MSHCLCHLPRYLYIPTSFNLTFSFFIISLSPLVIFFFFLNDPAPTEIYPLSLPDALPISFPDFAVEAALLAREAGAPVRVQWTRDDDLRHSSYHTHSAQALAAGVDDHGKVEWRRSSSRSEEHTSELQSHSNPAFPLLLQKK